MSARISNNLFLNSSKEIVRRVWTHLSALVVMGASFVICIISGMQLDVGSLSQPDSGLWPVIVASVGLILSIFLLVAEIVRHNDSPTSYELFGDVLWKKIATSCLAISLFLIMYPLMGFAPSAVLFMAILLRLVSKVSWIATLLTSIISTSILLVLFRELLGVRL